jgi:hypothetical protein
MESSEAGRDIDRVAVGTGPISRFRWSSALAGAVAFLSVALLLSGLALAIISVLAHPTVASTRGGALALWGSTMVATILGGGVGGWFAGRAIAGASPGLGAAHGFVTWGVALLTAFAFQLGAHRGLATVAGFEPSEGSAWNSLAPPPRAAEEGMSWRVARDYLAGASCSWFTTWLIAGIAATAAGAAGSGAVSRPSRRERQAVERPLEDRRPEPLRPTTAA